MRDHIACGWIEMNALDPRRQSRQSPADKDASTKALPQAPVSVSLSDRQKGGWRLRRTGGQYPKASPPERGALHYAKGRATPARSRLAPHVKHVAVGGLTMRSPIAASLSKASRFSPRPDVRPPFPSLEGGRNASPAPTFLRFFAKPKTWCSRHMPASVRKSRQGEWW